MNRTKGERVHVATSDKGTKWYIGKASATAMQPWWTEAVSASGGVLGMQRHFSLEQAVATVAGAVANQSNAYSDYYAESQRVLAGERAEATEVVLGALGEAGFKE